LKPERRAYAVTVCGNASSISCGDQRGTTGRDYCTCGSSRERCPDLRVLTEVVGQLSREQFLLTVQPGQQHPQGAGGCR
jgi:hypothetical protein